jgi:hypothetical protein
LEDSTKVFRVAARRALAAGDPSLLQLHFDAAVLERYRTGDAFSLIRTDTVGQLKQVGSWILNFGIGPEADLLHASIGDLLTLPEVERTHWAAFTVSLPLSRTFIQMKLSPRSCFEDGPPRGWD